MIVVWRKPNDKKKLLHKFHVFAALCKQAGKLFTRVKSNNWLSVINICKQKSKNDYFDLSGILYSFATASALNRLKTLKYGYT